jgi:hypothetical protein
MNRRLLSGLAQPLDKSPRNRVVLVMAVLDAPRASWDEGGENRFFRRTRLEDTMRSFHAIHLPHFQHFSAHNALVSAREKLMDHSMEIAMAVTMLIGVLMVLTFWAVVAH